MHIGADREPLWDFNLCSNNFNTHKLFGSRSHLVQFEVQVSEGGIDHLRHKLEHEVPKSLPGSYLGDMDRSVSHGNLSVI